jgi:hypothetical protein
MSDSFKKSILDNIPDFLESYSDMIQLTIDSWFLTIVGSLSSNRSERRSISSFSTAVKIRSSSSCDISPSLLVSVYDVSKTLYFTYEFE